MSSRCILKLQELEKHVTKIKTNTRKNQTKNPEINPYIYNHLTFNKVGKCVHQTKERCFNIWCQENRYLYGDSHIHRSLKAFHYTQNSTQSFLNVRSKIMNLLAENIGEIHWEIGLDYFPALDSKITGSKRKMTAMGLQQTKKLIYSKRNKQEQRDRLWSGGKHS